MLYTTLKEAKDKLINARVNGAGVETARQRYINILYNNELQILTELESIENLKKQIAELKEENELLNATIAEQDQLLAKKKR